MKLDINSFKQEPSPAWMKSANTFRNSEGELSSTFFLADENSLKDGSYHKLQNSIQGTQLIKKTGEMQKELSSPAKQPAGTGKETASKRVLDEQAVNTRRELGQSANALKNSAVQLLDSSDRNLFSRKDIAKSNVDGVSSTVTNNAQNHGEKFKNNVGKSYDNESVYRSLSAFAANYNQMLAKGENSQSTRTTDRVDSLKNLTSAYRDRLSQTGITTDQNGRLSLDRETFMAADREQVKELYHRAGSYADQIYTQSFWLEQTTMSDNQKANLYSTPSSISTAMDTSGQLGAIGQTAEALKSTADYLLRLDDTSFSAPQKMEWSDSTEDSAPDRDRKEESVSAADPDRKRMYDAVSVLVDDYNRIRELGGKSISPGITQAIEGLSGLTDRYQDQLSQAGIRLNENGQMSLDKESFGSADGNQLKNLFHGAGSYGYQVAEQAARIDAAASLEAGKANTYNAEAFYTNNYASGSVFGSYF